MNIFVNTGRRFINEEGSDIAKVAIIRGENRRENIKAALELIGNEIKTDIGRRRVIIKPNFVSTSIQLAASHVDQIRGILDFLKGFHKEKIIIAEAACGNTMDAFKRFGYYSLLDEYNVELLDLNITGLYKPIPIKDSKGSDILMRVSSLLLDKENYLISAAKLKTHDTVVVSLSIKNIAMGGVIYPDKKKAHQGFGQTNRNIAWLASHTWPSLAVIDGLIGMEGDGPIHGDPINVGIAIASTDPLASDRVACEIMDVDFNKVGYLHYCSERGLGQADMQKIEIIGQTLSNCIRPFRLHRTVEGQYAWRCSA